MFTDGSLCNRVRFNSLTGYTKACLVLSLTHHHRLVSHFFELLMKFLNNLLPFSHDTDITGVHIVLQEKLFAGKVFLLKSFDLFNLSQVFEFKLRDKLF